MSGEAPGRCGGGLQPADTRIAAPGCGGTFPFPASLPGRYRAATGLVSGEGGTAAGAHRPAPRDPGGALGKIFSRRQKDSCQQFRKQPRTPSVCQGPSSGLGHTGRADTPELWFGNGYRITPVRMTVPGEPREMPGPQDPVFSRRTLAHFRFPT